MAEPRADMFIDPEKDPRTDWPMVGGEREILTGCLNYNRETLQLKCEGLSPEQMATRAVEPSTLSLVVTCRSGGCWST